MPDSAKVFIRAAISFVLGFLLYLVLLIRIRITFPGPDGTGGPFRDNHTNTAVFKLLRHLTTPFGAQGYLAYANYLLMMVLVFAFLTWLARRKRRRAASLR